MNDGDSRVRLDRSGNLSGIENVPAAARMQVREALLAGDLERPDWLAELVRGEGSLRGAAHGKLKFSLLSPGREVVAEDRPTFSWEPLEGATGYRVQVADTSGHQVADSGWLASATTRWNPPAPLRRGIVYAWAVSASARWASDRFHVFERAVSAGRHLPGGGVADRNYVWLSDWQLENFKSGHLLPIDFETYRRLRNHVAKALVPLLQVWLYASRGEGAFEKRYEELCQMLGLTRYRHASKVREKLGPGLDELVQYGYISRWELKPSKDLTGYVLALHHGEKFHRDRRSRLPRPAPDPEVTSVGGLAATTDGAQTPPSTSVERSSPRTPEYLELVDRLCQEFTVARSQAESLVDSSPGEVKAQLEAYPWRAVKPANRAGWIVAAVRGAYRLPEAYLESRRKEEKKSELGARQAEVKACPYCRDTEGWRLTTKGARRCTHDRAKEEGGGDVI